jgi:hypothetical protein
MVAVVAIAGYVVLVVGFVAFGIACAVAAWFVLREASKQYSAPPPPTYKMDDAYEWVARHLDGLVAATLTPDDVKRILRYQVDFFQRQGVTQNGERPHLVADVVIGVSETVDYIIKRSAEDGETYLPEQVYPVVETQLAYLRAIGAVGPPRRR